MILLNWIGEITTTAGALVLATLGVGRMPLSRKERRAANTIAEANGFLRADRHTLEEIIKRFGVSASSVDSGLKEVEGIIGHFNNMIDDNERIQFASKSAILSLREENDALRAAINAQGRLETIAMLKGMTVEQRFQWVRINHECPVELHPNVGVNKAGRVINPLTGRYL